MSEKPESSKRKIISRKEIIEAMRIYRFILPYKKQFIIGMVCLVVSTGVVSFIPGGFGKLIDAASPAKEVIGKISTVVKSASPAEAKVAQITRLVGTYTSEISPEKLKEIGLILGIVLLIQA